VLTRFVALGAALAATGCSAAPTPGSTGSTPPASATSTASAAASGDDGADDTSATAAPTGSPIGVPGNACLLVDPVTVARLAGGRNAVATASNQGPFRSCAYRVSTEAGTGGTVYLDVADERIAQLYDVATADAQLSDLPAIGVRAGYSPSTGKVYVQTSRAFFTLTLPTGLDALSDPDRLRSAAESLAAGIVARLGP
jgi:hypothetical protein